MGYPITSEITTVPQRHGARGAPTFDHAIRNKEAPLFLERKKILKVKRHCRRSFPLGVEMNSLQLGKVKGKVWEEKARRTRDLSGRAIEWGDLPRLVPRFPLSQHFSSRCSAAGSSPSFYQTDGAFRLIHAGLLMLMVAAFSGALEAVRF